MGFALSPHLRLVASRAASIYSPRGGGAPAGHAPPPVTERSPRGVARDRRWRGSSFSPPQSLPVPRQRAHRQTREGSARGRGGRGGAPGPGGGSGRWPCAVSGDLVYRPGAGQCHRLRRLDRIQGRCVPPAPIGCAGGGSGLPARTNVRRRARGRGERDWALRPLPGCGGRALPARRGTRVSCRLTEGETVCTNWRGW